MTLKTLLNQVKILSHRFESGQTRSNRSHLMISPSLKSACWPRTNHHLPLKRKACLTKLHQVLNMVQQLVVSSIGEAIRSYLRYNQVGVRERRRWVLTTAWRLSRSTSLCRGRSCLTRPNPMVQAWFKVERVFITRDKLAVKILMPCSSSRIVAL